MRLTIHIILKELRNVPKEIFRFHSQKKEFKSWKFLNCLDNTLDEELIYITNYDYLRNYPKDIDNFSVIILCDTIDSELTQFITNHNLSAIVVFRESFNLFVLSNYINEVFTKYNLWDRKLSEISIKGGTLQEMVDVSQPFFENPVVISNKSFGIMAHTNSKETDEVLEKVTDGNYSYSQRAIQNVINRKPENEENLYRETTLILPPNLANCKQHIKSVFSKGYRIGAIVEFFVHTEPKQWNKEILEYFNSKVELLLENEEKKSNVRQSMYDYLLIDLINDDKLTKSEIISRGKPHQINYEGNYLIYKVVMSKNSVFAVSHVLTAFKEKSCFYTVTIYEDSVVVLHNTSAVNQQNCNIQEDKDILDILKTYNASLGISDLFDNLGEFRAEYKKACIAVKVGKTVDKEKSIYVFRDYFVQYLMLSSCKHIDLNNVLSSKVIQLMEADHHDGTENVKTLRIFLENERNVSVTAQEFFLHRNSILYRINKIEETLNVDLNDFNKRMELLLTFQAIDLLNNADNLADIELI